MLDLIAAVAVGAFLLAVSIKGNSDKLIAQAKEDKGFIKWAVAVGVLYYLYGIPELHEIFGLIIAAAFLGFLLLAVENNSGFFDSISAFWATL